MSKKASAGLEPERGLSSVAEKKPGKKKSGKTRQEEILPEEEPLEFLNRELQWIEFNSRVLHEALDSRTPLLERVRFLGIFTSNLDEFFMKRVGGLRRQVELGVHRRAGGLTPIQQLAAIRARVAALLTRQADCFQNVIEIDLSQKGIQLLTWERLTAEEQGFAAQYFRQNVFPVLTPLAVDPGLPFPFLSNLSTSLGVTLRYPDQPQSHSDLSNKSGKSDPSDRRQEKLFARIKVPKIFPQWIQVRGRQDSAQQFRFVSLMEMIKHNMKGLFPDMEVLGVMPFRITRNAEIERDEDDVDDLLEMVAEELKQRRFAEVVRLEHGPDPDPWMLRFLMDELDLTDSEVYELPGLLDYTELKPIADLPIAELKYEPWTPMTPLELLDERESIFTAIRKDDILVHHPYESFGQTVERFLKTAVDDPKVLAIKMTLYRTGDESPFIPLLARAADAGKQVVVLIELKARFDEERNIHWAQELENSGVHVVYGVVGLKTHAKVALVIRQDDDRLRCYAHFGTGNYHRETSKLYTDFGLFTCRTAFTDDAVELFHFLTGRSLKRNYQKILVAPMNMKDRFLEMIRREGDHARAGRPARIVAKCNSLEDASVGRALYEASKAGVQIDLIVRGFSCVRAGVPGLSERIRLISVIGRFLEHSRLFFFQNGEADVLDGEFLLGSADWMYRNLLARVETVVPIEDHRLRKRLWEVLDIMLNDRRQAWEMRPDGTYLQLRPQDGQDPRGTQELMMDITRSRHPSFAAVDTPETIDGTFT